MLEMEMNRAILLRQASDWHTEIPNPRYVYLEIRVVQEGVEVKLLGSAQDRWGKRIMELQAVYFKGML
jgi:hypothetical protein